MGNNSGNKISALQEILVRMGSVLVGFSGGVDSAFLLKVAKDTLKSKAVAATATAAFFKKAQLRQAKGFTSKLKIKHVIFDFKPPHEFWVNNKSRCYVCKKELSRELFKIAGNLKLNYVIDATHLDDLADFRPGRAALLEAGIRSPLLEAGFNKSAIRQWARKMKLECWEAPATTCLATRIPFGDNIDMKKLRIIEEAENFISRFGVLDLRVRMHGSLARIEVDKQDFALLLKHCEKISSKLKHLGFSCVTVDFEGYRQGSMNPKDIWKKKN